MSELPSYLVEFFGTFFFLSTIIITGSPIPIAIALFLVIYFGGNVSGGHYNPAVTFMFWLNGEFVNNDIKAIFYVIAQLVGAGTALIFYNSVIQPNLLPGKTISQ
jgi:glycerol uptake facilitator-like aquaporin